LLWLFSTAALWLNPRLNNKAGMRQEEHFRPSTMRKNALSPLEDL